MQAPIGVFDSGLGGLTVLKELIGKLPDYDYLYLGDNARAPYGTRSFDTVYKYTRQCVQWLFDQGCPLVILACNTASAKALRNIQQMYLPGAAQENRVLGVIRPTAEVIGNFSRTGSIGVLATQGTVLSDSYPIEIAHYFPHLKVAQEACPMWVPLVENAEHDKPGADYFVQKHIDSLMKKAPDADTLLLGCTHYPLLMDKIKSAIPKDMTVVTQGELVADSLADYLNRHPEMAVRLSQNNKRSYASTDSPELFDSQAALFLGQSVASFYVDLG
jgi:glutamate racemase